MGKYKIIIEQMGVEIRILTAGERKQRETRRLP